MRASYEVRYEKMLDLAEAIGHRRDEIIGQAVRDIRCTVTESLYRPIFGDDIRFHRGSGEKFVEDSLKDPSTSVGGSRGT